MVAGLPLVPALGLASTSSDTDETDDDDEDDPAGVDELDTDIETVDDLWRE